MSELLNGEFAAWTAVAELVILCLAGYTFFRRRGNTLSEACAYGLVTTLMMLSLFFQLAYMIRLPNASFVFEIALVILASGYIIKNRQELLHGAIAVRVLYKGAPLASTVIGLLLLYLALQALAIPPTATYWQPLGQVLLYARHRTLFPADIQGIAAPFTQTFSPFNTLILPHLFLRFQTDWGVGLLGFMAYLSVGFSTYALSRRYSWPPTAATASIIVISMPRLVYLSTSPGYELIPAATALFCLLAVFRAVESPNLADLYLLVLGLLFMLSGTFMNLVFPLVLAPLACILLFRRHGATAWWKLLSTRPYLMLMFLIPAVVFSQLWYPIIGLSANGNISAPPAPPSAAFNSDGIQGALANMLRYTLQSIHFTRPVDSLLNWETGFSPTAALQKIYDNLLVPILGNRGAVTAFRIAWVPNEKLSWFGPFGFLMILPAVGYAIRRAPRRLKAVSVTLIAYVFLVSLIPAWHPDNVRYFDVFFVCGGICIAFFLPPWRLNRSRRRVLVVISASLMLYAGICNDNKPAFNFLSEKAAGSIWQASSWGRNRYGATREAYGDDRLAKVRKQVTAENHLWLIYTDFSLAYPYLLIYPNARTLPIKAFNPDMSAHLRKRNTEFIMFIDCFPPPWITNHFGKTLWSIPSGRLTLPGALLKVD